MGKLVTYTLFLTALSASVFSSPHEIYFEKVISDGENIAHVEPILDSQKELHGFIYTDSVDGQIIYENILTQESATIEIGGKIFKTIHSFSDNYDTLYLYSLNVSWLQPARLHKISIFDDKYTLEELVFPISGYSLSSLTYADLRFDNNKLVVEISFLDQPISNPPDWNTDNFSRSFFIDLNSFSIKNTFYDRNVFECNLVSEDSKDNFVISEIISSGYSRYSGYYENSYMHQRVYNESGVLLAGISTDLGETYSYFVDNFSPSSKTEELITHSNSLDILGNYNKAEHVACYSFAEGFPTEIWYNDEIEDVHFSYVYKAKDLLVGTYDTNKIIMLNYLSGDVTDTSYLVSSLSHLNFFETNIDQPILNVVGMSGDTVKSYRFDISTDLSSSSQREELPITFSLLQNHPNPFNGETRLEFSNTENQYLKLTIFNILGHEVKTLVEAKFAPGNYSYYWNGDNDQGVSQSTGIYFARLESLISSEMIKLIYLK